MDEKNTSRVTVYMPATLEKTTRELAKSMGMDLSTYVRFLILKAKND